MRSFSRNVMIIELSKTGQWFSSVWQGLLGIDVIVDVYNRIETLAGL